MKKSAVALITLCFLMSLAAFANSGKRAQAATSSAAKVTTKQASGTIVSTDASSLEIKRKVAGKNETMTFVLNPETKKSGELVKDGKATVHYKVEGSQNIATSIKATPPPAATQKRR